MTSAELAYYEQRAPEYDDWYLGARRFAARVRLGWEQELRRLIAVVSSIEARAVLDVACGTAFLTRYLPGPVTALDRSAAMLRIARERLPRARILQADALRLPFPGGRFDCLAAGHFYGHLRPPERSLFLAEARRVASQLLIVDAAWRQEVPPEEVQERVLNDGSRHSIYKRYFTPEQLLDELGGGAVLHAGRWFVAVRS